MRITPLRAFGMTAVLATATFGFAPTANSHDGGRRISFTIDSGVTPANFNDAFPGDIHRCDFSNGGLGPNTPCVVSVAGQKGFADHYARDIAGVANFEDAAAVGVSNFATSPTSFDFPYTFYWRVVGSVSDCGSGSFILRTDGNLNNPVSAWTIVPGSGRGELVGLRGNGTETAAPLTASGAHSDGTGRVRCGHSS
jgi:Protein of unknown function (DUF3224)